MPPELLAQFRSGRGGAARHRRRRLADGRVRGGRRARRGRGPLGRPSRRRARRHPVARQGHGPVRPRGRPGASPTTGAKRRFMDHDGVVAKFGVPPASIPDYLALVGDCAGRLPGPARLGLPLGRRRARRATRTSRTSPPRSRRWDVSVRGAASLALTLRERRDEALLYRELATLRLDAPIPQTDPDELRWRGAGPVRVRGAGGTPRRPRPALAAAAAPLTRPGACAQASSSRRVAWCSRAAARMPTLRDGRARSNQGPPSGAVTSAPPSAAMTPAAQMSHSESPLPLDVGVEAAVRDVGQPERRGSHRAGDADGAVERRAAAGEAAPRQADVRDRVDRGAPWRAGGSALPSSVAPWPATAAKSSSRSRVEHDSEDRPPVDDEADADREERQAVRVVHGAVERVDDPQPAARAAPCPRSGRTRRARTACGRTPPRGTHRRGTSAAIVSMIAASLGGRPR